MAHVHASVPAKDKKSHHEHWEAALDEALLNASDMGRTGEFDVAVEFSATIEVTNPGRILAYSATLVEKPTP
ncbi:MAG TPA: hypothetical protein VJ986_14705 [Gaiellaceae bacterium]|nr:hypothetical protein [Gaiellaceae bacterium]